MRTKGVVAELVQERVHAHFEGEEGGGVGAVAEADVDCLAVVAVEP